ncbi:MAG: winged helix-turn-helix transcriptional regulator [Candidatus Bathyarchaeia archaeon]
MKKTEVKLISELILNSRRSDRELAKAVGVSQPTVGRMIKKLEKEGYIREYTIVPDFQRLGYHLMALIFVKLKQGLTAEKIEETRRIAQESLKTGPFEVVMLERGIGLGYDGVFISFHKDYASYLALKDWFKRFTFLELTKLESFLINLDDKVRYRPLTFAALAKHVLLMAGQE